MSGLPCRPEGKYLRVLNGSWAVETNICGVPATGWASLANTHSCNYRGMADANELVQ